MKVMVTGGAGFIGSHVVDVLIENGYEVVIVDNLANGSKANINKKAKFYEVDITSKELNKVFAQERPDFVCHQAAHINVRNSLKDPVMDSENNILGSINLLELCKQYKVKKVVYASSGGAIYGEPEYMPCDENHPIKPLSPYGVSKYAVELFLNYYHTFGLDFCALRYANVYGPRQDPLGEAGVVAIFANKLLSDQPCKINGDGEQTRDFVYVKDVARANLLAIKKNCKTCAVNIGVGCELSINELYEQMTRLLSIKKKAIHGPAIKGEVYKIYLDIKKAKEVLGWKPKYDFDKGLQETLDWFKK